MDMIRELFDDVSDEYFDELKKLTTKMLKFRVIEEKDITRSVYLEKVYDYLEVVNMRNGINPRKHEYVSVYIDSLLTLLDHKVGKGSRAEKYLKKAKSIESKIKANENECAELLKDFTRIFVSLYVKCLESNEPLNDFDFALSKENLSKVYNGLKNEKKISFLWVKEKELLTIF